MIRYVQCKCGRTVDSWKHRQCTECGNRNLDLNQAQPPKMSRSRNAGFPDDVKVLEINVQVFNEGATFPAHEFDINLADASQRRYFAEQMTNAYLGNQYVITSPTRHEVTETA